MTSRHFRISFRMKSPGFGISAFPASGVGTYSTPHTSFPPIIIPKLGSESAVQPYRKRSGGFPPGMGKILYIGTHSGHSPSQRLQIILFFRQFLHLLSFDLKKRGAVFAAAPNYSLLSLSVLTLRTPPLFFSLIYFVICPVPVKAMAAAANARIIRRLPVQN